MNRLMEQLNELGSAVTLKELSDLGVVVLAANTPTNSFIGMYKNGPYATKIHAYYDYVGGSWKWERA